jgi:dipeptidyl aminopeptidase/acylaminoacyl peptidase/uncharacterized protein (DUF885 family)
MYCSRTLASFVLSFLVLAASPRLLHADVPLADDRAAGSNAFDTETADWQNAPADESASAPQQQQRGGRPAFASGLMFKDRIAPHWLEGNTRFWYRNDLPGGAKEFVLVDAVRGAKDPAFDHEKLATALSEASDGKEYQAARLPFESIEYLDGTKAIRFKVGDKWWKCDLSSYECSATEPGNPSAATESTDDAAARQRARRQRDDDIGGPAGDSARSPDGKWTAYVKEHNVYLRSEADATESKLTEDGKEGSGYGRVSWSPDSKTIVAFRIEPGENKEVYLIQSSPPGGGRAKLQSRPYPLPGDKFTAFELNLFDVGEKKQTKPDVDRIDFGWPRLRWNKDGSRFTYQKNDRGHQRFRVVEVDVKSGTARNIIDEKSKTFIWTAHAENVGLRPATWLQNSDEIIYASERDGWRHLYLIDAKTGDVKSRITQGEYVVRGVEQIDEDKRQVWFRASGKNPNQDPYLIHYYRVNFDGSDLTALTDGDGNHAIQFSPDRKYIVDSYSRVDMPPVHELRRVADGSLVLKLEDADISPLKASGWEAPEVFVAKGRDGTTDIWGIICRPKNFDPAKKYPVIEQIYAGPQGSFVPKTFSPMRRFSSLTDLGFIVVQMDGMGTANRSKAFHDVCWRNLKDAGFPDRILWHQAVAKKYPYYDLSRVGITGGSAGGQNSTGGLLFHPEFYKVAVSSCGCHDNRMDKASWNEQWMGYPVGPWYSESSNIDNAGRLRGKLLLIVGEMDTNVPPESTLRLADALIKAGKDFDLLVVPGANHGNGGPYGQRRQQDYFVRHLMGTEPPDRNAAPPRDESVARTGGGDDSAGSAAREPAKPRSETESLDLKDLSLDKSEIRGVIERYGVDRGSLMRSLPPAGSPVRDARLRDFNTGWADNLEKLDFDGLSQDGKVDYLLLKNHLSHERRQLDIRAKEREEAAPLLPFAKTIYDLDESRRELKTMDWSKVAGTLTSLSKEVADARRTLEKKTGDERPKRTVSNRALASVEGLRGTLREWFTFYDGYDPLFTWWSQEPYKAVDQGLQSYAEYFRDRLGATSAGMVDDSRGGGRGRRGGGGGGGGGGSGGGPAPASAQGQSSGSSREQSREIIGNPIGREALLSELAYEMIPYSPEELIELANKEFAWCENEMKKASREMGYGDDWKAALEHVKTLYVEPGKQPDLIRKLALEAIEYLDSNNLVTVPQLCRDSWRMDMMTPDRQLVNPFFTGGEVISVSFPTNGMSHEAKMMSMRGNNIHFARATVHHELIPGHHLQGYMTSRYKAYRGMFSTPFWGEGWALYWELLLWDRGFAKSPENKVGMLFWRMHRCARIIFSLSFHLDKMTPQECIDFLVDRVGHERDNATAEVRRSFTTFYGPLYQAAYLLGGLQLRSLHRELVETGTMTDRAFHDAVLKENQIPIEMVRALVGQRKLTRDYTPSWKFYGAISE